MSEPVAIIPKGKQGKYILIALVLILILVVIYIVYKVFFQFDNTAVKTNVQTAAAPYADPAQATLIINDGINHILADTFLTQQVLDYAAMSGVAKEQVLVNTAVAQAKLYDYL